MENFGHAFTRILVQTLLSLNVMIKYLLKKYAIVLDLFQQQKQSQNDGATTVR